MAKKVFCIGNGESRQGFDLEKLRPHGKIYGCNGLYRDFTPDVLCSVDGQMMHEIYHSGYGDKNELWLRDWNPIPGVTYNMVVYANLTPSEIEIAKKNFKVYQNERGDRQEFVFHGSNISGQVGIIRRIQGGEQIESKQVDHTGTYISWINPDDKTHTYSEIGKDRGWSTFLVVPIGLVILSLAALLLNGAIKKAKEMNINVPLVVRLAGTNFKEGKEILDNSGLKLISAENLDDAAKKIVEAIK